MTAGIGVTGTGATGIGGLKEFLRPRPPEPTPERCELCGAEVATEHQHLVNVAERSITCACRPCALLFVDRTREIAGRGGPVGYRTIPDRYLHDPDFTLTDAQWDALQIPVAMAFFFLSSAFSANPGQETVMACYPSPAGATESELDLAHWSDGVGAGQLAAVLEPDVEALLVRRSPDGEQIECLLVPVDACYRLVGLVRLHWRGFDGGSEAWTAIDAFFDDVRGRARELRPHHLVGRSSS